MPTPYMTGEMQPLRYQDDRSSWEKASTMLNVVSDVASVIGNIQDSVYRSDYSQAKQEAQNELRQRALQGYSGTELYTDSTNKLNAIVTDNTMSKGRKQAFTDVYSTQLDSDITSYVKERDEYSFNEIANIMPTIDSVYLSRDDIKEITTNLAQQYKLPKKTVAKAMFAGAQSSLLDKAKAAAETGSVSAVKAIEDESKLNLKRFNIPEMTASRSNDTARYYQSQQNNFDVSMNKLYKQLALTKEQQVLAVIDDNNKVYSTDPTIVRDTIKDIKKVNPSKAITLENKYEKALYTSQLSHKYNDLTTPIPPEAWDDKGFKDMAEGAIVSQITGATNPEYKVSVINAQSGHLSKVSKYYEELAASNPSVAYSEYLKLSKVPGGEQAAYKLMKKDTLNNIKDISILQRVVTNTEGNTLSTREAQDALAKGANDPFTPTSESKKARDEYFTQINNSAIPISLKRDAQTSMDKLYASTGNPLVYKTVYDEYVDKSTEEVSDINVYKATAGKVNERMVDKFKQDLSEYGTYEDGWFEDNTYIEGDGSGGLTMYEKDSLGILPPTPIAKLSSVEVTNLSGDTERQKKVTAAKNNIIHLLGKIPILATTIVRQAYDNTFINGEGAIQDVLDATEPKQEKLQTSFDFLGDYLHDASDVLIDYFANMNSKEDTNATK